jgi:hypothetical protein
MRVKFSAYNPDPEGLGRVLIHGKNYQSNKKTKCFLRIKVG